jgi:uncharacterized protein (UPF0332 family)
MINENDRQSLVDYRLRQATDTIELAHFLAISEKYVVAVNRVYYGMYYALTALALRDGFETSKHGQLIGWFNREYIATKMLNPQFGKILRNAFHNRTKGDYDAFIEFSKNEVDLMLVEMTDFINEIKKLLQQP